MVEADKDRFKLAMATMAEVFQKECPQTLQKAYWSVLGDLSIEQFESAANRAMLALKWFPKPVELIELVRGSTSQRSEIAWSKVVAAMDQTGCSSAVEFDDPAISHAIQNLGGWIGLCNRPKSNDNWTRKEFVAAYQNFDGVALRPARLRGHSGRVVSWRDGRRITGQSVKRVGHVLSERSNGQG